MIERDPPPGLVEEYFKKLDQLDDARRVYIEVDEQTTKEDIEKASHIARAWQKNRPPSSRPPRNRLTCIECAVLKDQHDWGDEQVAKRYGWEHIEKVRKHAEVGRAIIEGE